MENSAVTGQLERLSLGRVGVIGELYDARSESFTSRLLLKGPFPEKLIKTTDNKGMDLQYKLIENFADRCDLFNVQGELQMAIALGLIKVGGSAQYLTESMKSGKTVSCSLICKLQTVNEKLIVSAGEILQFLDLESLNDPHFTHVIVGINWGANCLLSLDYNCRSDSEKEKIEGSLKGELSLIKKLLEVQSTGGKLQKKKENSEQKTCFNIKVNADLVPGNGWPTTLEGFHQFMKEIPKLLKDLNGGKGKPLSYIMLPLSNFRSLAKLESPIQTVVGKIDESFIISFLFFLEEVERTKRKIYDLLTLFDEKKKYVPEKSLKEVREKQQEISEKESKLKTSFREEWVLVRSGKKNVRDIITQFERSKYTFNLFSYEDFLDSFSSIHRKLSSVESYTSQGVQYLCQGETLGELLKGNPSGEFIVMVTSSEMAEADPKLQEDTSVYFMSLVKERAPNTVFVVVDLDCLKHAEKEKIRCYHLKQNQVLCDDLLAAYLFDRRTNFARLKSPSSRELCKHKPGNRVCVKIVCPGYSDRSCSHIDQEWYCFACKSRLEYGFDGYYYCCCGKAVADSFEYRCTDPKHGNKFIPAPSSFLKNQLSQLRPLKEMNLLVIGQSGVGKSTWINSILNYLTYETLAEATEYGPQFVIATHFSMYDPKIKKARVIKMGEDANEETEIGRSSTQSSRTYRFFWKDLCVRIIDTPGLGDNRGIEQDQENLRNVMDHISRFKELHGVCILLKAGENKLSSLFTYCIKELLIHLHKSIARNIVFCFTSARTSFYKAGDASILLEKVFTDLKITDYLSLGEHNMFFLDNEAFLFLCALENGMTFDEKVVQSYAESWNMSLAETKRLLTTVKDFQPHRMEETISLVKARARVLTLTKPLAEANKTILMNIDTYARKEKELRESSLSIEDLRKKMKLSEMRLIPEELDYPQTVCTSPGCVSYLIYSSSGVKEIEYSTVCHDKCELEGVTPKTVNNHRLKSCVAMNFWNNCKKCGCSWANHMHLTCRQKRVEVEVINKKVEEDLQKELSERDILENFLKELKNKVSELESEKEFITKATAIFGAFLKQHAVTVYNDSLEEYLLYLINEEEKKEHKSVSELQLLKNLEMHLESYRAEVQVLTKAIESGNKSAEELTVDAINKLEKQLYDLTHMGKVIKKYAELNRSSAQKFSAYTEQAVSLNEKKNKKSERFWNKWFTSSREHCASEKDQKDLSGSQQGRQSLR